MELKRKSYWLSDDIRKLCIRKNWYTVGTNEQYSKMLHFVNMNYNKPTNANIFRVAYDIAMHSENINIYDARGDIENIMFHILNDVVSHSIEIIEDEEPEDEEPPVYEMVEF